MANCSGVQTTNGICFLAFLSSTMQSDVEHSHGSTRLEKERRHPSHRSSSSSSHTSPFLQKMKRKKRYQEPSPSQSEGEDGYDEEDWERASLEEDAPTQSSGLVSARVRRNEGEAPG